MVETVVEFPEGSGRFEFANFPLLLSAGSGGVKLLFPDRLFSVSTAEVVAPKRGQVTGFSDSITG